jgi:hypothetical protein
MATNSTSSQPADPGGAFAVDPMSRPLHAHQLLRIKVDQVTGMLMFKAHHRFDRIKVRQSRLSGSLPHAADSGCENAEI